MKVKCINNSLCNSLTVGKEYSVIDEGDLYFVIVDDIQEEITTKKDRFIVVEDGDLVKKTKAIINELSYQLNNDFQDIKDIRIRKNAKGEIKEVLVKFNF